MSNEPKKSRVEVEAENNSVPNATSNALKTMLGNKEPASNNEEKYAMRPAGNPTGKPRTGEAVKNSIVTSITLPVELKDDLEVQAFKERIKPSALIRKAIIEYLERHEDK